MNTSLKRRLVMGLGGLALTGATVAGANPAQADPPREGPTEGQLCTATENIAFYSDGGHYRYTVNANEYIRIDAYFESWGMDAIGPGEGLGSYWFSWRHTDGTRRVRDCHFT
jgi:hypothetical protein